MLISECVMSLAHAYVHANCSGGCELSSRFVIPSSQPSPENTSRILEMHCSLIGAFVVSGFLVLSWTTLNARKELSLMRRHLISTDVPNRHIEKLEYAIQHTGAIFLNAGIIFVMQLFSLHTFLFIYVNFSLTLAIEDTEWNLVPVMLFTFHPVASSTSSYFC